MAIERDAAGMAILEKAGAVIAALESQGEATAAALAEVVDEPVSSTYRLLSTLKGLGWIDAGSRRGLYRLGVYVVRVGGLLEDRLDVRRACTPVLEELRERTGETSFLCFRRGDRAVCVERIGGRDVQSLAMRLGDSFPLYRGAAPLAILSFLPDEERRALLAGFDEARRAGADVPGARVIRDRVARTREAGHSISDEDVTPGIAAVGAPVFNHRGELEVAISLSGLRDRILSAGGETIAAVGDAAVRASRALGFTGEAEG